MKFWRLLPACVRWYYRAHAVLPVGSCTLLIRLQIPLQVDFRGAVDTCIAQAGFNSCGSLGSNHVAGFDSRLRVDPQEQQPTYRSPPHNHQGPAFAFDYGGSSREQPADTGAEDLQLRRLPLPHLPLGAAAAATASSTAGQAAQYTPPLRQLPEHLRDHLPTSHQQHQVR